MASFLSLAFISVCLFYGSAAVQNEDGKLQTALFSTYSKYARPYTNESNRVVTVTIDTYLSQLIDLDAHLGVLKLSFWMRLRWTDPRLTWTPANYSDLKTTFVSMNDIWLPDIFLYDESSIGQSDIGRIPVSVSNTGNVAWSYPVTTAVSCNVDLKDFPHDEHTCQLKFSSWRLSGAEMNFKNHTSSAGFSTSALSPNWEIVSYKVERHVLYYTCCPEPYPDVTFYLTLRRRSSGFASALPMPAIVFMILMILGFKLPLASKERIILGVVSLLGMVMFAVIAKIHVLPPASSAIDTFYVGTIGIMLFSILFYIITLKMYHCTATSDCKPPQCLRCFCFNFLAPVLCMCHIFKTKKTSEGCCGESNSVEVTSEAGDESEGKTKAESNEDNTKEWRIISMIFDRLFMFIVGITFLIFALVVLL